MIRKLPETQARRHRAIVLDEINHSYLVGMVDPSDILALDDISKILKKPIRQAIVKENDVLRVFDQVYRHTDEISSRASELHDDLLGVDDRLSNDDDDDDDEAAAANEAPVVRLLESIFKDAIQVRASDIHIEPDEEVLRIRQRVDGVLNEYVMKEKRIVGALVLRLKLMAKLNISEKRLPQDGRFQLNIVGKKIDVRLSTMPIQYGESVVMRLLERNDQLLKLDELGFPEKILKRLKYYMARPHGMILVTGPTGSGKSTTLYACLSELNKAENKIITVEDPVDYSLPRINQVQVNPKINLTFATVLRSALRQDPHIVMIGEMRDQETAEIGLRAAMTGHLVFSTLHTNDAISSAVRLIDMGTESYLAAAALRVVIAQRLVRKLCPDCSIGYDPTEQERSWLLSIADESIFKSEFKTSRGCQRCNNSGYHGRMGVYEFLELEGEMLDALRDNQPTRFSQLAKISSGYIPLIKSALDQAIAGKTSLEEVFRVAGDLEESAN